MSFARKVVMNSIIRVKLNRYALKIYRGGSRGGCRGCAPPPPPEMTFGFLIQLVFCEKKKTVMFIGVEVEKETSAPPPKTILDPPLIYIYIYLPGVLKTGLPEILSQVQHIACNLSKLNSLKAQILLV